MAETLFMLSACFGFVALEMWSDSPAGFKPSFREHLHLVHHTTDKVQLSPHLSPQF